MLVAAFVTGGCAAPSSPQATAIADGGHPLTGRIWDARTESFVARDQLLAEAAAADHVLLGEVHVNPHHHEAQQQVLVALVARGRRPALVFEMMERDQQAALDEVLAQPASVADDVARATGFDSRGWDWPLYRPLVETALADALPVRAGNAPAADTGRVVRGGLEALDAGLVEGLGLDRPLPPPARAALVQVMIDSHCGHAGGDLAERLVDAQRLRDATMADVMLTAGDEGTVLITGAGHARRDYGVPLYLTARGAGAGVLAVAFVEVVPGAPDPSAYVDQLEDSTRPYDYLWFTPRIEREDPCEQFREGLKRLGDRERNDD